MAEPTLVEVFGANAVQDVNTLTISKTDLATTGLTASVDNTAESLFVAMFKLARTKLNTTNQSADPDIQVTIGNPQSFTNVRNGVTYNQINQSVSLEVESQGVIINPDSY
ncbi:MAG: hypothetical protein QNJ51_03030 [Calothrix sp. MO_167.B12]|nr:hypothetical protein [Calothrix sp. MO_167.B12]